MNKPVTGKGHNVTPLQDDSRRSERSKDQWSQLLEHVGASQDRGAFHQLFEHFGPQIKYYAISNGIANQAEELVQEVMISIWRRASTYDWRKAAASTWIFTIARNQRIDMLRKIQRGSAEMAIETEDLWQIPGDDEKDPVPSSTVFLPSVASATPSSICRKNKLRFLPRFIWNTSPTRKWPMKWTSPLEPSRAVCVWH